jgi:hypothetical protein
VSLRAEEGVGMEGIENEVEDESKEVEDESKEVVVSLEEVEEIESSETVSRS